MTLNNIITLLVCIAGLVICVLYILTKRQLNMANRSLVAVLKETKYELALVNGILNVYANKYGTEHMDEFISESKELAEKIFKEGHFIYDSKCNDKRRDNTED